jgi:hypothetical protein
MRSYRNWWGVSGAEVMHLSQSKVVVCVEI